jgi:hypothetical protein
MSAFLTLCQRQRRWDGIKKLVTNVNGARTASISTGLASSALCCTQNRWNGVNGAGVASKSL